MNAQDREHDARATAPHRPALTLLTREAPKPPADVTPPPRCDNDHPPDEPGYGHGV
jgi:hypothetical protein